MRARRRPWSHSTARARDRWLPPRLPGPISSSTVSWGWSTSIAGCWTARGGRAFRCWSGCAFSRSAPRFSMSSSRFGSAGLKQQIALRTSGFAGPDRPCVRSCDVPRTCRQSALHDLVDTQYSRAQRRRSCRRSSASNLRIHVRRRDVWSEAQHGLGEAATSSEQVQPVLTPVATGSGASRSTRTINKSLNFVVTVKGKDAFGRTSRVAVVQAPRDPAAHPDRAASRELTRFDGHAVRAAVVGDPGQRRRAVPWVCEVRGCYQFRVTRNSDLWVDEEEVEDFLMKALQGQS